MGGIMTAVARLVMRLLRDDDAQDLIEYALLIGLIAIVAVVGVGSVGSAVSGVLWKAVTDGLSNAL
jgi:Flp pilus assembly pilin Flp